MFIDLGFVGSDPDLVEGIKGDTGIAEGLVGIFIGLLPVLLAHFVLRVGEAGGELF